MNEEIIFNRIEKILTRMDQKKQLQTLAKDKGIAINELELTDDTSTAVVLSVIALMLAKMDDDPRYKKLQDFGMQKRSLKVELINDYKQKANMLYNKYKTRSNTEEVLHSVDEEYPDDEECVEEGFGFTTKKNICNRICEQIGIINPYMEELNKKLKSGEISSPKEFRKWYRREVKVHTSHGGGHTGSGDTVSTTSYQVERGDPTLDTYIHRAKEIFKMSLRKKYKGDIFSNEEYDKLESGYNILKELKEEMSEACKDGFNSFKEYNPKAYKELLKSINDKLGKWIKLSKEINEFVENKI